MAKEIPRKLFERYRKAQSVHWTTRERLHFCRIVAIRQVVVKVAHTRPFCCTAHPMRIIAGERKGSVLKAPKGDQTRPTLSRVRESLFSILGESVVDSRVADLYAGAGGLGLEALSRGAVHCVFVEKAPPALEALRSNVAKLRYESYAAVIGTDVEKWLQSRPSLPAPLDLVFLDPPYGLPSLSKIVEMTGEMLPLAAGALVVVQCSPRDELLEQHGLLRRHRLRIYGETALHLFSSIRESEVK